MRLLYYIETNSCISSHPITMHSFSVEIVNNLGTTSDSLLFITNTRSSRTHPKHQFQRQLIYCIGYFASLK